VGGSGEIFGHPPACDWIETSTARSFSAVTISLRSTGKANQWVRAGLCCYTSICTRRYMRASIYEQINYPRDSVVITQPLFIEEDHSELSRVCPWVNATLLLIVTALPFTNSLATLLLKRSTPTQPCSPFALSHRALSRHLTRPWQWFYS